MTIRHANLLIILTLLISCGDKTLVKSTDTGVQWDMDCEAPCERLYGVSEDPWEACSFTSGDMTSEQSYRQCMRLCTEAARAEGDMGDYDPDERQQNCASVALDNNTQVEVWAACIEWSSCDDIESGYCCPVW